MARVKMARSTTKTNGETTSNPELKKTATNGEGAARQALVEEQIRVRAYELFEQRGKTHGHAHEDWLRAEAEVRQRMSGRA